MWIHKFFRCYSQTTTNTVNPLYKEFMGAGCVFTDGKHVLAGYQPQKKNPCITGIGGHREEGENYLQTAMRETVEEVYNISTLPHQLVPRLIQSLPPRKEDIHKNYVMLHYNFDDFKKFMKICKKSGLVSPVYRKLPRTVMESIRNREVDMNAEISHLCLLPVIKDFNGKSLVHPYFIQDMKMM